FSTALDNSKGAATANAPTSSSVAITNSGCAAWATPRPIIVHKAQPSNHKCHAASFLIFMPPYELLRSNAVLLHSPVGTTPGSLVVIRIASENHSCQFLQAVQMRKMVYMGGDSAPDQRPGRAATCWRSPWMAC